MSKVHHQLKQRRQALGLRQQDMEMRIGMPRQQYQRLEAGGNPRLETLELVAKGMRMQVMLVPEEKVLEVEAVIAGKTAVSAAKEPEANHVADDPWRGLLGDDE